MNRDRLLKLADLLEADAANDKGIKFDLRYVAIRSEWLDDHTAERDFAPADVVPFDCGTAACAVGLAVVSGAFKEEGLTYRVSEYFGVVPVFGRHDGWGAAEEAFFELTEEQSDFLFQSTQYPRGLSSGADGERYVAQRIRDFVAGKVEA